MTIQTIDTVTPEIGLKGAGEKLNANFTNPAHAASYEVGIAGGQIPRNSDLPTFGTAAEADTGSASGDVPTNANLSAAVCGTSSFSGDVYTFTPSGSGFRPLQAGMYLSFKLPSGSANTTTTPDINYNGSTYVIKWIDGSALAADDLDEAYNKQPVLFYFDGTDMLIVSDICGLESNDYWIKKASGVCEVFGISSVDGDANGTSHTIPIELASTSGTCSASFGGNFTAVATTQISSLSWVDSATSIKVKVMIDANGTRSIYNSSGSEIIDFHLIGRWY